MSWLQKLKQGLVKTSGKISESLANVFTKQRLDQNLLDELEEILISSDIGVATSAEIIKQLAKNKFDKEITTEEVKRELAGFVATMLQSAEVKLQIKEKPHVIMMCGVNGNGKTTTIGKLAAKYQGEGNTVTLAACDTFRAAAIHQLQVWAARVGCEFVAGAENSDPASVAFKAVEVAKTNGSDLLFIDTAGRLHNKTNLMEELSKIIRIVKKHDQDAPHEVLLVIDATTGQNALSQVENFKAIANISGLIITKLDGTAKAGIVVALVKKYNLPIYYIGVGEQIEDLQEFSAVDFANSLMGI